MGYLLDADYEDLPDNDHDAFVSLETLSRQRMHDEEADQNGNFSFYAVMRYMNEVSALAQQFEIPGITYQDSGDNYHEEYGRFTRAVEFQTAQIRVQRARRLRRNSVEISGANRERIQKLLERLKAEVQGADIPEKRKQGLLDRIGDFETELSKKRFDVAKAMMVVALAAAAANDFVGVFKEAPKLTESIIRMLGSEQVRQEEIQQLIPRSAPLKALEDQRPQNEPRLFDTDLDDDVPF